MMAHDTHDLVNRLSVVTVLTQCSHALTAHILSAEQQTMQQQHCQKRTGIWHQ
jgi:hypothetical protein